ncbi:alpha/beta fold hydrolase [Dactylosporangium sp. NPDC049140]|uniref:alpha/beta fold hydrolase n=1 Tax=Dactylosporangium sp. NPDC049140 TaxID=3155647 RepID=UPI00340AA941
MSPEGEPPTVFATRDDGLKLAYQVIGAPDGFPVFLLHGMPGSRIGPRPRHITVYRQGIRLICYDRPGYGRSDRREGRDVADAARDVEAIADRLGLDRFAVVGRSGGGPHALACAADPLLHRRITSVAVLVSLAPADGLDLDWYSGMNPDNVRGFGRDTPDTAAVDAEITRRAELARKDPRLLLEHLQMQMTAIDRTVVSQSGLRRAILEAYREGLRNGPFGWIDDTLALGRNWKFLPESIDTKVTRVSIWHGRHDTFAPVSHAEWLANAIPGAEVNIEPNAAHFNAMEALPQVLARLGRGRTVTVTG